MLRCFSSGLAVVIYHDAEREIAYDRDFKLSPLKKGLDEADEYGLTLVSKDDWEAVFHPELVQRRRSA